jgi:hypothetical protein
MMRTPWGISDYKKDYCEGVTFYSTPSHGGFHVQGHALDMIPKVLQQTKWAPLGWFEEDCDWAIVVYFLQKLFPFEEVQSAYLTLANYHPNGINVLMYDE